MTCICYESKLTILVGLPDLCNLLVGTGAQDFNEALYICSCFTDTTVQSFGIIESLYGREKSVYKKRRERGGVDRDEKNTTNVEILDTSRSQWYNAEPLRRASIPSTFITFSFLLSFYFNSRLHSYF